MPNPLKNDTKSHPVSAYTDLMILHLLLVGTKERSLSEFIALCNAVRSRYLGDFPKALILMNTVFSGNSNEYSVCVRGDH